MRRLAGPFEHAFSLVVAEVCDESAGGVPSLDGCGSDPEASGHLGEREHPASTQTFPARPELIGPADARHVLRAIGAAAERLAATRMEHGSDLGIGVGVEERIDLGDDRVGSAEAVGGGQFARQSQLQGGTAT